VFALMAVGASVAYFAAAIGGFTDLAGNGNRGLSVLYGAACSVFAVLTSALIVLWMMRPSRSSRSFPRFSRLFYPHNAAQIEDRDQDTDL
jgi:hypothetical protein